ncbi:hypothetical protein CONPUDRAFT_106927 [Coniophora puteana RWD-64-598 SS2]|uniref:Oxidase ustYa n=1 Tax=Coniophora puteana (strain RWD-64-598) TaxID=741705 RepID=A0A5M3MJU4_CONPW|nr:uncharacterized protein CONPUDRAFT_106927 [Coniophora puteana RWD-64-598 SS2]EIW78925.1 hypothetical protein CONPUDRAFT_106927 [Coniophora puteana RWD-64-598 SS2]
MEESTSNKAHIFYLFIYLAATTLHVVYTVQTVHVLDEMVPAHKTYTWQGDDYPDQLPIQLPAVALEMADGEDHYDLHNDEEWSAMFPNDGFLTLGPENRTFMMSMIHQFHCLDVIRVGMVANRTGSMHHVEHCLRYLRQIILCNSDVTLEVGRPRFSDGMWRHTTDGGSGMVHRCKDWTVVRDYMIQHPPAELNQAALDGQKELLMSAEGY